MKEAKQPKSLAEMAAEAEADPWVCRRCGCRDWRVVSSYAVANGNRHRRRVCRHCGQTLLTTVEMPRENQSGEASPPLPVAPESSDVEQPSLVPSPEPTEG